MSPAIARRRRYRTDPEYRAAILESNRRGRARGGEYRKRMDALAATICRVRDSLDARLRHAERLEKRLLALQAEKQALRERRARGEL
jgi:predicted  nucleic acid-binding Zn-ribbon protein